MYRYWAASFSLVLLSPSVTPDSRSLRPSSAPTPSSLRVRDMPPPLLSQSEHSSSESSSELSSSSGSTPKPQPTSHHAYRTAPYRTARQVPCTAARETL